MKKTTSWLAGALACVCALVLVLAGCGGSQDATTTDTTTDAAAQADTYTLVEDGKLICVSDMANPPFSSYKEGTSEPEGFEVDLMDAIGEKLGMEVEWLPKMDFDAIIPLIKEGGKADLGVAQFTITDERAEQIDFTDPYYEANLGFVTSADTDATSSADFDADGIRVAAQGGTTGEAWVKEHLPNAELVSMEPPNAMAGINSDLVDAMVADLPVVTELIDKSYSDLQVLEPIATGEQYGIVVSKDNPALTAAINDALSELEADGTIAALIEQWNA